MPVLNNLPVEISTEILSNLTNGDLARVCHVSRQMRDVSQRVLYTAPSLTATCDAPSIQILLRTLLSPGGDALAKHVRSLSVRWEKVDSDATQFPADMALFAAAAARFQIPHSVLSPGTQVVLLLHLLPHLQVLALGSPYACKIVPTFLQTTHTPFLHQLREFRQHPSPNAAFIRIATIHALLRLPRLRTIDVRTWYEPINASPTSAEAATAPGTSPITSLRLWLSCLPPATLQEILILPSALTHFSFSPEEWAGEFDISLCSLAPLRATLTHLDVDLSGIARNRSPGDFPNRTIGNFRDWPVLHTVRCSLMGLLGQGRRAVPVRLAEVLPIGLKDLELLQDVYWVGRDAIAQVVGMLEEKEAMLPLLERLVISAGQPRDLLKKVCRAADVVRLVISVGQSSDVLMEACRAADVVLMERKPGGE